MPKKSFFTNLQHFELSQFLPIYKGIMVNSAYFVKSTPPMAFSVSF